MLISGINARNHGVYEIATPNSSSIIEYFAGFQNIEFASGLVATPKSPIPPALESGVIIKKGTADVIVLTLPLRSGIDVCALLTAVISDSANNAILLRIIFIGLLLIVFGFQMPLPKKTLQATRSKPIRFYWLTLWVFIYKYGWFIFKTY